MEKKYILLALDHRGSLFKALKEKGEENLKNAAFEFKKAVITNLCQDFSGVLLDPEIGLKAYKEAGCQKPFLLCLEKSGYEESLGERLSKLEYSASFVKKMGAKAAKLLLYFNPKYPSKEHQIKIAREVLEQTKKQNLPLFLEIVVYEKDGREIEEALILESVKIVLKEGVYPQVFKLQPPKELSLAKQITKELEPYKIDWIVLTQGIEFEEFKKRLRVSLLGGAKGFLAGRSIWKEAIGKIGEDLQEFLKTTARKRFREISNLALSL